MSQAAAGFLEKIAGRAKKMEEEPEEKAEPEEQEDAQATDGEDNAEEEITEKKKVGRPAGRARKSSKPKHRAASGAEVASNPLAKCKHYVPGKIKRVKNDGSTVRRKSGRNALREIRHYQIHPELINNRSSFKRVVREIVDNVTPKDLNLRISGLAFDALQEVAESFVSDAFMLAQHNVIDNKREMVKARDLTFAARLLGADEAAHSALRRDPASLFKSFAPAVESKVKDEKDVPPTSSAKKTKRDNDAPKAKNAPPAKKLKTAQASDDKPKKKIPPPAKKAAVNK